MRITKQFLRFGVALVAVAALCPAPSAGAAAPSSFTLPVPVWTTVTGRVQRCAWSFTPLSGTRCRGPVAFPRARIRYFGFKPSPGFTDLTPPMFVSVWDVRRRTFVEGPYEFDRATRTAWVDGRLATARPPKIGRAQRQWVDRCVYWLYSRARATFCQKGTTVRLLVKRTASNVAAVRLPNGRYRTMPGYTWHAGGTGFYALDASRLRRRVGHPMPVLASVASGPPRAPSATDYRIDGIAGQRLGPDGRANPGSFHTYCSTRAITVHVDYGGATAAGYSAERARQLVTTALAEMSAASGYRWVMGARIPTAPIRSLFQRYAPTDQFHYPLPVLDNDLVIGFSTHMSAAYNDPTLSTSAGIGGPDLQIRDDGYRSVTFGGIAVMNADWLVQPTTSPVAALTVMLHEIGHTFGLGHVTGRQQSMNPDVFDVTRYGAGDASGMAFLRKHSAAC